MLGLENEVKRAFERYRKALEEALEATLERAQAEAAVEAARKKATCYHCRGVHHAAE